MNGKGRQNRDNGSWRDVTRSAMRESRMVAFLQVRNASHYEFPLQKYDSAMQRPFSRSVLCFWKKIHVTLRMRIDDYRRSLLQAGARDPCKFESIALQAIKIKTEGKGKKHRLG